jgi:PAS domain S-box-containing protein
VHSGKTQLRLISDGRAVAGSALAVIIIVSLFSSFELPKHLLRSDLRSFLGEQSHGNTILFATIVAILGVAVAFARERRTRLLDITDRKNTEEALRKSERQSRFLFERNPHPMWAFDAETLQFLDVNEAAIRRYGYTREEFLGMKLSDISLPEDFPAFLAQVSSPKTGFNDTRVWRHRSKDGSILKVEITGFDFTVDGRPAELVFASDVTEREQVQERLEHSRAQMLGILGSAMDGVITVDSDHNIVLFNSAAEKIFGCSAGEVIGTPIDRFVPGQLRRKHSAGFEDFSHSHRQSRFGDFTAVTAGGREFPVEASVSQIEVSGQKLYTIILRDITERRLAEEQQQQLQSSITKAAAEWRLTFDAVTAAILVLDMNGKIERLNLAAKQLIGVEHYEDALGRPILDFATREPWREIAKLIPGTVESRSPVSCQVGEEGGRTWDLSALIAANEGVEERVIIFVRDVTQIIALQASLRRSEAMASMGTLVAGVAHEVRNPLFGISSTVDTFEACFGDRSEFGEYISILRGEVERLRKLMQELLEYGRPPTDEHSAGSVNDVIESAIRACYFSAKQAEVTVKAAPTDALQPVLMNPARLVLLFKNLIENAVQHSPKGSEVLIETQRAGNHSAVVCNVADSGPGFREQDLSRVFEPFFSRRQSGTGLGLSIVQRIVEEHGGAVRAGNRDGGGAIVQVSLPALQISEAGSDHAKP